jgi:polysaccharide biosynthesis protein PslH
VQTGGGIKTKLVEALGFNLSAVSTQTGAAGINREICGNKLTTCADNDWYAFATAIITAANRPETTPAAFYAHYYWPCIARAAAAKIKGLVGK